MRKVVVNTTPLIALSHVGQLEVLKKLYSGIIIPEAVYRELSVKADSVCKKAVDSSLDWIQIGSIQNQMAKSMIGLGTDYADLAISEAVNPESEVYAIGCRKGSDMTAEINKAIEKLSENGTLAALAEKYGLTNDLIPNIGK